MFGGQKIKVRLSYWPVKNWWGELLQRDQKHRRESLGTEDKNRAWGMVEGPGETGARTRLLPDLPWASSQARHQDRAGWGGGDSQWQHDPWGSSDQGGGRTGLQRHWGYRSESHQWVIAGLLREKERKKGEEEAGAVGEWWELDGGRAAGKETGDGVWGFRGWAVPGDTEVRGVTTALVAKREKPWGDWSRKWRTQVWVHHPCGW